MNNIMPKLRQQYADLLQHVVCVLHLISWVMVVQLSCIKAQMTDGSKPIYYYNYYNYFLLSLVSSMQLLETQVKTNKNPRTRYYSENKGSRVARKKGNWYFRLINPFVCLQQWMNNDGWNTINVFSTSFASISWVESWLFKQFFTKLKQPMVTSKKERANAACDSYTLHTPAGAAHQWTESTNTGCNQWLSLAKITLKVPLAGRNRSLVASTSRCGEGVSPTTSYSPPSINVTPTSVHPL